MIHIWHEDSENSVTTQLWKFLANNIKELNNADIRGYGGNEKLREHIEKAKFNSNDMYYIFMDYVLDNNSALNVYIDTKRYIKSLNMPNIIMSRLTCIEFMLLEYKYFISWTKPLSNISKNYIEAEKILEKFVNTVKKQESWINDKDICKYIIYNYHIDTTKKNWQEKLNYISSEKISALLCKVMTNGGKLRFNISKTILGDCWQCNCCNLNTKKISDLCWLYTNNNNATSQYKANMLWKYAVSKYVLKHQRLITPQVLQANYINSLINKQTH